MIHLHRNKDIKLYGLSSPGKVELWRLPSLILLVTGALCLATGCGPEKKVATQVEVEITAYTYDKQQACG